jgi:plasmid stabilization system protein ParE
MPRVVYSQKALEDLVRLRDFLKTKSPEAAKRAVSVIRTKLDKLKTNPEIFRPVPHLPYFREIMIEFGSSGYVARFYYKPMGEVVVLRIKHQLEETMNGFPDSENKV